ncbi:MAG: short-chain dehydrogenase [Bacillus thermozeamaize]|jgi:NAD(P)-dependent dehydrogenase (short-subunit alcohol dehydrogenase family)|uniref:Short-chain dehydrogenase n=1 Tax=Bacillus thermozeamaize TaxID=230954 RepID=A0A1Y3PL84_9BACI|nr:MAG: short-chain dehydrogenase [Bacillus thermozeamaize]
MRLAGKVAVVTGGASGIGRATAQRFAREGAKVVVADVQTEGGEATVRSIQEAGGEAIFVRTNTANYEEVQALVDQALSRYGQLDVMFNNAGISSARASVLDMPLEEYHRTVSVNQHGVFYGIKAAGNAMKERGGVIINTASVYGFLADRKHFPYHASKAAVVMMTKAAALDLAPYNIRVVAIAPGLIETGIVTAWKQMPDIWEKVQQAQMRRRAGTPEEVANVVTFLASDEASFVNGSVIFVDDGAASFKK